MRIGAHPNPLQNLSRRYASKNPHTSRGTHHRRPSIQSVFDACDYVEFSRHLRLVDAFHLATEPHRLFPNHRTTTTADVDSLYPQRPRHEPGDDAGWGCHRPSCARRKTTDQALKVIAANCPSLTDLDISGDESYTDLTDESIMAVAANCPALTSLSPPPETRRLPESHRRRGQGHRREPALQSITVIAANCPSLTSLRFSTYDPSWSSPPVTAN